ncbi:hypothetical protein OCL06_12400 [Alteromonas sp. ASW11-19]|uniref:Uncharacterized protein n=1 Tax=Alteromonas salexigens TaxID=2982530 RepID=A0ABT2VSI0_9ALTE|nr:hypothetical protein [Alteromonas salexigens]MCU7555388.1 hypothetical protein [Alteromonas salexigens]
MKKWLILAALVGSNQWATASEVGLLERFEQKLDNNVAAVKTQQSLPQSLQKKACRLLLSQPKRAFLRNELSQQVGFTIDSSVSYFSGAIENIKLWRDDGWQYCSGQVEFDNYQDNLAGLAVRAAWAMSDEVSEDQLSSLLKLSLRNSSTSADAVVLIAFLAPTAQQFSYLQKNLVKEQVSLDVSRLAAAKLYIKQQDYGTAITILSDCTTVECRRLKLSAETEKERQDAHEATDLGSYFSGS